MSRVPYGSARTVLGNGEPRSLLLGLKPHLTPLRLYPFLPFPHQVLGGLAARSPPAVNKAGHTCQGHEPRCPSAGVSARPSEDLAVPYLWGPVLRARGPAATGVVGATIFV